MNVYELLLLALMGVVLLAIGATVLRRVPDEPGAGSEEGGHLPGHEPPVDEEDTVEAVPVRTRR